MLVKSRCDINGYYPLKRNGIYIVYGIALFSSPFKAEVESRKIDFQLTRNFVNPIYSGGMTRNEGVYFIECILETGRKVLMRFNMSDFDVVDTHIPLDWVTLSIDMYAKAREIAKTLDINSSNKLINDLDQWTEKQFLCHITGFPELTNYDFFISISEDNMEEEYSKIFSNYKQKYEALYFESMNQELSKQ